MREEIKKVWKQIKNRSSEEQTSFLIDAYKLYNYDPLRLTWFYVACFMVSLILMIGGFKLVSLFFLVVPAGVYYYHWGKYLKAEKVFSIKWLR